MLNRFLLRWIEFSLNVMMRGLKLLQDAFGPDPDETRDPAAAERMRMAVAAVGANPGLMPGGITLMVPLPVGLSESEGSCSTVPLPEPTFPRLYVPEPGDDNADEVLPPQVERRPLRVFRPDAECA